MHAQVYTSLDNLIKLDDGISSSEFLGMSPTLGCLHLIHPGSFIRLLFQTSHQIIILSKWVNVIIMDMKT